MLIVNQTKDIILNLDNVAAIYIEKKTCSIKATVVGEDLSYHLATYQSLEDCKMVLSTICELRMQMGDCYYILLPLGGDVDKFVWKDRE